MQVNNGADPCTVVVSSIIIIIIMLCTGHADVKPWRLDPSDSNVECDHFMCCVEHSVISAPYYYF